MIQNSKYFVHAPLIPDYCACGRCRSIIFEGQYIVGYQKYNLTAENTLELFTFKNYACVSYITIALTYFPKRT